MQPVVTTTKERPIIFGDAAVRAILAGRKTQTRRVVKGRRQFADWGVSPCAAYDVAEVVGKPGWFGFLVAGDQGWTDPIRCPYGVPGDRLWVRETWREVGSAMMADGSIPEHRCECRYRADDPWDGPWRPSIYMPRWASRITLEVTAVRVGRLCDIGILGCVREGVDDQQDGHQISAQQLRGRFRVAWDAINAKRGYGWESNPWVWGIEFRRVP